MLAKTLGTLPSQAKAQRSFQIHDSGIINCRGQPDSPDKGSLQISDMARDRNQYKKLNQDKRSPQVNNSKIAQNPQDLPSKFHNINTSRRYNTSESFMNQKSQIQSKILTQLNEKDQQLMIHTNAFHFDQVYSPSRIQYIGVKREPKSSKSWFKKSKPLLLNECPQASSSQIPDPKEKIINKIAEKVPTSKSQISQRKLSQPEQKIKQKQVQRYSYNGSFNPSKNGREMAKKTEQKEVNCSYLKMNPEHQEFLSKSRVSALSKSSNGKLSQSRVKRNSSNMIMKSRTISISNQIELQQIFERTFNISLSKKAHFEKENSKLNDGFQQITTKFETEMTNSRMNYHNRLRQIRSTNRPIQQGQSQDQINQNV